MIIKRGNRFRHGDPTGPNPDPLVLTEDTEIRGGNFVLARFEDVGRVFKRGVYQGDFGGRHILNWYGGNLRGAYINGAKWDSYVWQRFEPLALAVDILAAASKAGGDDATGAWLWSCGWLIDNPAATYAEWQAAYVTWADTTGNLVYSAALFVRLRDRFFPGQGFPEVRDAITAESLETWEGKDTHLVEEHS